MIESNWRTSTYSSGNGQCAEISQSKAKVMIRDTQDRDGAVLAFTGEQWLEFISRIR